MRKKPTKIAWSAWLLSFTLGESNVITKEERNNVAVTISKLKYIGAGDWKIKTIDGVINVKRIE